MAVGVTPVPGRQRQGPLGRLLPAIGGAVGGIIGGVKGGPTGALAGASAGTGVGQVAGQVIDPTVAQAPTMGVETTGMQRRQQALQQDPLRQIQQAQMALQTLPPEQLPETRKAFEQAMMIAQRNIQMQQGGLA